MANQLRNVIVINGKKYDAVTGQIIKDSGNITDNTQKQTVQMTPSIDGFSKRQPTIRRTIDRHKKPIQKSQTLMRQSVHKPSPKSDATKLKHSQRHATANATPRSPHISRYSNEHTKQVVHKKVQHLPVKKESKTLDQAPAAPPPMYHTQRTISKQQMVATSAINETFNDSHKSENASHSNKSNKKNRLVHKIGVSARAMSISAAVLSGLLLGSFFAIQNVPQLSMRVAAARAGFDATMPGYRPSGFSFAGPIQYSPGEVTVTFKANADDRQFSVIQRSSNWNSDALLSNFVLENEEQYQTYVDRGRTLYIYGGSNATWIDNGIWYQIQGDSQMTTDQLVRVASSI